MKFFWKYYLWDVRQELEIKTVKKVFYLDPGDEIYIDGVPYAITGKKEIYQGSKSIFIYVKEKS